MARRTTTTAMRLASPESAPEYEGHLPYQAGSQEIPQPPRVFLGSTCDVFNQCRDLLTEQREHMIVFFLDVRHKLVGQRWTMAIGSLTGVECHPRELFREAITRGAAAIIVAHNHPSGDSTPSRQDIELTSRFRQVGELVGISVLDHIVVSTGGFMSLRERGWC